MSERNHNQAPNALSHEKERLLLLQSLARSRDASSARRLDSESGNKKYNGNVLSYPLVSKESHSGNYEEGITHLMLVGDMVLAVSRGINRKIVNSAEGNPIDSVRVSVLPMGEHASVGKHSSMTLLETNPSQLHYPRANGVVQPWEEVVIGRQMLEGATGTSDAAVSRNHAKITISAEGGLTIEDFSTNGTQVINETDLGTMPGHGGFDEQGRIDLAGMMQYLQEHSWEWTKDTADTTVISAQ